LSPLNWTRVMRNVHFLPEGFFSRRLLFFLGTFPPSLLLLKGPPPLQATYEPNPYRKVPRGFTLGPPTAAGSFLSFTARSKHFVLFVGAPPIRRFFKCFPFFSFEFLGRIPKFISLGRAPRSSQNCSLTFYWGAASISSNHPRPPPFFSRDLPGSFFFFFLRV